MTHNLLESPIVLTAAVKHYAWGKTGQDSLVGRLIGATDERPYAELWFGTHALANVSARVGNNEQPLSELIQAHAQEILGERVLAAFGPALPFLFKVLSIAKPLSLQLHPGANEARKLHEREPTHYPDFRHKPELAIAINGGEVMSGFLGEAQYSQFVMQVPTLQKLFGRSFNAEFVTNLVKVFCTMDTEELRALSKQVMHEARESAIDSSVLYWLSQMEAAFPSGDPAILLVPILQHIRLSVGDGVFNGPNVPHVYLSGNFIECMACSDNVVRLGLTQKYCDREAFAHCVSVEPKSMSLVRPIKKEPGVEVYEVEAKEFQVQRITPPPQGFVASTAGCCQLLFCSESNVLIANSAVEYELPAGKAFLLPAALGEYTIQPTKGTIFRVIVPK